MRNPNTGHFVKSSDIRTLTAKDGTKVDVIHGEYRRVGNKATGKAFLIVSAQSLVYVNRRGEVSELSEAVALSTMATWSLQASVTAIPDSAARDALLAPAVPFSDLIADVRALILA